MLANQVEGFKLEQRSVIKFLMAEKCKPYEIYRRMWDVYWEVCFSKNYLVKGNGFQMGYRFNVSRNSTGNKHRSCKHIICKHS